MKITRRSAIVAATSLAVAPSARAEKAADTLRIQFVDAVPNVDMYFNSQRTGLILAHRERLSLRQLSEESQEQELVEG